MDLQNFKEECRAFGNNLLSGMSQNAFFYFVREKFNHLSPLTRKTLKIFTWGALSIMILYFPLSRLWLAGKNMKDFHIKRGLTEELLNVSSASSSLRGRGVDPAQAYTRPVQFIQKRIPVLQIPKNQIKGIAHQSSAPKKLRGVKKVEVQMTDLNVKEVVQYGRLIERLAQNIKLIDLHIRENPKRKNYFHVSYGFGFFSLGEPSFLSQGRAKKSAPYPLKNKKTLK